MSPIRFLFLAAVTSSAAAQDTLPEPVARILQGHGIPARSASIFVQEVRGDRPVLNHNGDAPFNPASTVKLLTTWVALDVLGPTYTWPTEVHFLGHWDGRALDGDLALKGYGDPFLVTEEMWKLLGALRRLGLEEIRGDLVLDSSFFQAVDGDPGEFDGQPFRTYNVPPSALLVNFKAVRFQFLPDPENRAVKISADPWPTNLEIDNRLRLLAGPCLGYQAGIAFDLPEPEAGDRVVFSGAFPAGCTQYSMSRTVLQHDSYAFGVFEALWAQVGGRFHGRMRSEAVPHGNEPMMIWRSRPLGEVLRSINKFSNNVMTRQLVYTLGAEGLGAPGSADKGVRVITDYLLERGLAVDPLILDNGAGLSRSTRISAQLMAEVLLMAYRSEHMPEFLASLSLGGLDGTTRGRFDGHAEEGKMHVKTGRLDDVSALAGFVHAQNGHTYVVVVFLNAPQAHRGPGEEVQDHLLHWVLSLP